MHVVSPSFASLLALFAGTSCGSTAPLPGPSPADEPASTSAEPVADAPPVDEAPPGQPSECRVEEDDDSTDYSFDAHGRTTVVISMNEVSAITYITRYAYDARGRVTRIDEEVEAEMPQPDEPASTFEYEEDAGARRVVSRESQGTRLVQVSTWTYDEAGRPISLRRELTPNPEAATEGPAEEWCEYDSAGRPARHRRVRGTTTVTNTWTYEGDETVPTQILVSTVAGGRSDEYTRTFTTDAGVLTSVRAYEDGSEEVARYDDNCVHLLFPAVCSARRAPTAPGG